MSTTSTAVPLHTLEPGDTFTIDVDENCVMEISHGSTAVYALPDGSWRVADASTIVNLTNRNPEAA